MKKKLLTVAIAAMLALGLGTVAFAASEVAKDVVAGDIKNADGYNTVPTVSGANSAVTEYDDDAGITAAKKKAADVIGKAVGDPLLLKAFNLPANPNAAVTITLGQPIAADRNLIVLHKDGDSWKSEKFTWGATRSQIKLQWASYSPVAIVEYKPAPAPAGGGSGSGSGDSGSAADNNDVPTSPKTGAEFPMAAVVALAAMAGAAVCVKKFAVKE